MTWYSGWNRLEGYDMGNWTLDEWKWLVDWSLLHKCNGWAYVNPGELQLLKSGEAKDWQTLDGFAEWAVPPHEGQYRCYLGNVDSGWAYGKEEGEITWRTAPVPAKRNTAVAFVAGSGYAPGKVDLSCNGEKLVSFDVAKAVDQQWEENGVVLRFILGGDTRNETTTFGISGIYVLMLPASKVTAGKPLTLSIKTPSAGGCDWFMLHEYRSIQDEARHVMCPKPVMPAIAAFTPHLDQRFGVTVAEYEVDRGSKRRSGLPTSNVLLLRASNTPVRRVRSDAPGRFPTTRGPLPTALFPWNHDLDSTPRTAEKKF
jgi:hypothetical protein